MRMITRVFATLKQAEVHQNKLYGQYGHVRLVSAPRFTEEGVYSWEVK